MNLNKGGILTFEMVRQCIMEEEVATPKEETNKPQSFIGIWEEIIRGLRTDDDGTRFTTAESYECALKSLRKILGPNMIKVDFALVQQKFRSGRTECIME